jgi:hypothetical protein
VVGVFSTKVRVRDVETVTEEDPLNVFVNVAEVDTVVVKELGFVRDVVREREKSLETDDVGLSLKLRVRFDSENETLKVPDVVGVSVWDIDRECEPLIEIVCEPERVPVPEELVVELSEAVPEIDSVPLAENDPLAEKFRDRVLVLVRLREPEEDSERDRLHEAEDESVNEKEGDFVSVRDLDSVDDRDGVSVPLADVLLVVEYDHVSVIVDENERDREGINDQVTDGVAESVCADESETDRYSVGDHVELSVVPLVEVLEGLFEEEREKDPVEEHVAERVGVLDPVDEFEPSIETEQVWLRVTECCSVPLTEIVFDFFLVDEMVNVDVTEREWLGDGVRVTVVVRVLVIDREEVLEYCIDRESVEVGDGVSEME